MAKQRPQYINTPPIRRSKKERMTKRPPMPEQQPRFLYMNGQTIEFANMQAVRDWLRHQKDMSK